MNAVLLRKPGLISLVIAATLLAMFASSAWADDAHYAFDLAVSAHQHPRSLSHTSDRNTCRRKTRVMVTET